MSGKKSNVTFELDYAIARLRDAVQHGAIEGDYSAIGKWANEVERAALADSESIQSHRYIAIPETCLALDAVSVNPITKVGKVIEIRAFEKGYYRTRRFATQEAIDQENAYLGVDKPTAEAMADASMFGWDKYLSMLRECQKRFDVDKVEVSSDEGLLPCGHGRGNLIVSDVARWCNICGKEKG